MDTLIEVSEYLNNLKAYLDDGDSSETKIDGQEAWDAELDFAYSHNYITYEMLGKLGFMRLDYGNYGRRMVKEVRIEIHGFNFLVDFMVIDYANEGEMQIDITMLEGDKNIDTMLASLLEDVVEVRSTSDELVKMGKANRNKSYNVNKIMLPVLPKIKEIPPISSNALTPIYHPLSLKKKEKILEALDRKYKELEEQKPTIEVLENYMVYRKKLDEPIFLVLDISVDKELPILLGRLFLRTCGAIINVGLGTITIDDGVIHYFPKPRAKAYLENFNVDKDWLGCFEVGYDEDGNHVGNKMLKTFLLSVKKFPLPE
nr:hypothetical protein [Tanacetum cinerariifolium]